MTSPSLHKPLYLTQEEALGLLEMCLLSSAGADSINNRALCHLGDLCREFLRDEDNGRKILAVFSGGSRPQKTRDAARLQCV